MFLQHIYNESLSNIYLSQSYDLLQEWDYTGAIRASLMSLSYNRENLICTQIISQASQGIERFNDADDEIWLILAIIILSDRDIEQSIKLLFENCRRIFFTSNDFMNYLEEDNVLEIFFIIMWNYLNISKSFFCKLYWINNPNLYRFYDISLDSHDKEIIKILCTAGDNNNNTEEDYNIRCWENYNTIPMNLSHKILGSPYHSWPQICKIILKFICNPIHDVHLKNINDSTLMHNMITLGNMSEYKNVCKYLINALLHRYDRLEHFNYYTKYWSTYYDYAYWLWDQDIAELIKLKMKNIISKQEEKNLSQIK